MKLNSNFIILFIIIFTIVNVSSLEKYKKHKAVSFMSKNNKKHHHAKYLLRSHLKSK